jgi:phosphoribosyl-ATP pyrophosphohydrolase/phosphoribosyl-AMP cyclohydrolase
VTTVIDINALTFNAHGRITVISQTLGGQVLQASVLDRAAVEAILSTLTTQVGSTDGQALKVKEVRSNGEALLLFVEPEHHTVSAFPGDTPSQPWLEYLEVLLKGRKADASLEGSYTQKLFARGIDRIAKKVVEEAGEVIIAAKNYELDASAHNREEYLGEAADLLFHLQVLLVSQGFGLADIAQVLQERHRQRS